MSNQLSFIQQIEHLSTESQAKLADYIAFLQWQEAQAQAAETQGWSFSFIEAFKDAAVYASREAAGLDVSMAPATVGGETRPALWAHPPVVGQAVIEYHVPVPQQVHEVWLRLAIGIRDGAKIAPDNLVAFSVRVNGLRVWGQQSNAQSWQAVEIPLNLLSGDMVRIEFATEALGSHQWTWAVWGSPELVGQLVHR
ncbi:MAG: hypothetical protein HS126_00980 [Anaerolineales bacterium]|nr:hypothetical protein [Anaerolineales bacterium]